MKYFLDTEFIECFKKPIKWLPTIGKFNKPYHSIQLISIGIVAEDGREYYAVSNEYNPDDASDWVKINVLCKIATVPQFIRNTTHTDDLVRFKVIGAKSNKEIAKEITEFARKLTYQPNEDIPHWRNEVLYPEFYGYYCDYDWVVFCSLFGTMMDLPKGFPMYCRDLKQMFDEKAAAKNWFYGRDIWSNTSRPNDELQSGDYPASLDDKIKKLKTHQDYPAQFNEHNALADAKWNFELYKFLQTI